MVQGLYEHPVYQLKNTQNLDEEDLTKGSVVYH
jgi:hypothetical protein